MTTTPALGPADFEQHRAQILTQLGQHSTVLDSVGGQRASAAVMRTIFVDLFGDSRSEQDKRHFFLFMAPIFRRLAIARITSVNVGQTARMGVVDLEQWLARLEGFDSRCVQMIDLHYFVGLSTRSTAQTLGVSTQIVIRDLRFAKAWLQARTRWLPAPPDSDSQP